jgi:hypothetical protein
VPFFKDVFRKVLNFSSCVEQKGLLKDKIAGFWHIWIKIKVFCAGRKFNPVASVNKIETSAEIFSHANFNPFCQHFKAFSSSL